MSEKKRTAVHEDWGEVQILAGPEFASTGEALYWVRQSSGGIGTACASLITFPPKAESFENVYYDRMGGARYSTRKRCDEWNDGSRLSVLHRWQDQSGQWFAELLNDE